jgi:hypothetical protein
VTGSNRPTCCKAGADLITRRNADTCADIDRAGWSINFNHGGDPDPAYDNISFYPYCGTRLPQQNLAPVHADKRLIVIDPVQGLSSTSHFAETRYGSVSAIRL